MGCKRKLRRDAETIIDCRRLPLRTGRFVRHLGFAQRQMVEILKAVSRGARVLILDEPTSLLCLREEEMLFALLADLTASGIGLVCISHRMAEIFHLADCLSIVRDGRIIGPLDLRATSIAEVSELTSKADGAGRAPALAGRASRAAGEDVLRVEGLRTARKLDGLSFFLRRGEILGVAGLVGSGRSTLAKALFGLLPAATGRVTVAGRTLRLGDPARAIQAGLAFVPEERGSEGLALNASPASNIALPTLGRLTRGFGAVPNRRVAPLYEEFRARLGIAARGAGQNGRASRDPASRRRRDQTGATAPRARAPMASPPVTA